MQFCAQSGEITSRPIQAGIVINGTLNTSLKLKGLFSLRYCRFLRRFNHQSNQKSKESKDKRAEGLCVVRGFPSSFKMGLCEPIGLCCG
jgi:hypothetical protein